MGILQINIKFSLFDPLINKRNAYSKHKNINREPYHQSSFCNQTHNSLSLFYEDGWLIHRIEMLNIEPLISFIELNLCDTIVSEMLIQT